MKYLVMERHESYVIVLDEQGRFYKAANMDYSPGQTLTKVVPMEDIKVKKRKRAGFFALFAAVIILTATAIGLLWLSNSANEANGGAAVSDGSLVFRLYMGGEVALTCGADNKVLKAEGTDENGKNLVSQADLTGKDLNEAAAQLLDASYFLGLIDEDGEVFAAIEGEEDDDNPRLENFADEFEEYAEDKYDIEVEKSSWEDYLEDSGEAKNTEEKDHYQHEHK